MQTSEVIRRALGGNKFEAMVNPKDFVTRGHDLQFKFPKSRKNKSNMIKIELNGNDLFDVTFYNMNMRKFQFDKIETFGDIGIEQLKQLFEDRTGYATNL